MVAPIGVVLQCFDGLPDRQVEQDQFVLEHPDCRCIAVLVLHAPYESQAAVSERIQRFQQLDETRHDRIVERRAHARNIRLGKVEVPRHRYPLLFGRTHNHASTTSAAKSV
jgi:hypothetical protein